MRIIQYTSKKLNVDHLKCYKSKKEWQKAMLSSNLELYQLYCVFHPLLQRLYINLSSRLKTKRETIFQSN